MTKIIISIAFLLSFLVTTTNLNAIKAYPFPITITQPDGTKLTVRLNGDEFHHFTTSEDGYLLKKNQRGFMTYAKIGLNGEIIAGENIAKDIKKRTSNDLEILKLTPKAEALKSSFKPKFKSKSISSTVKPKLRFPSVGAQKSLIILVNFSDKAFATSTEVAKTNFTNLLNQDGYSANGGTGSARDYFMASSFGKFVPTFDVVGPVTLPQTLDFYGKNDATENDTNPAQMIVDACNAANAAGTNFANYDTDNDGYIDNVFVYYAGYNEAEGAPANTIWPHRYGVYPKDIYPNDYTYDGTQASITYDGKVLIDYACTSELQGTTGTSMCGIGTFCHEFGHVLGLPDYYHTASDKTCLDDWSIMDYGGYSNNGRTPPAYSAYDRFFLGYLTPQQISSTADITLLPLSQVKTVAVNTNNQSFLIASTNHNLNGSNPTPKEFFMVEYRKKTGWDSFLPAEGMLIWHIDYDQSAWDNNEPNNYTGTNQSGTSHMRVYLQPLVGSTTTPGAPFTTGSFVSTTWSGTNINREISNIVKTTDNITFKFMSPKIATTGSFSAFSTTVNTPTEGQSVSIAAKNLSSNLEIVLTNNENFEMKLSSESVWSKSLSLAPTVGEVNVTIQVRYNPIVGGTQTTQLKISSTGLADEFHNLSGTATVIIDPNAPKTFIGKIENLIQFPSTKLGITKTKTYNIKTTDITADLVLSVTGTNSSLFTISVQSITKDVANSFEGINITVNYAPNSIGNHTAILTIAGPGLVPQREITLNGTGIE